MNIESKLLAPFIVPVGFHEWLNLPFATPFIPPGAYNYRMAGKVLLEDNSTQQFQLQPAFNVSGAPTLSESKLRSHFNFADSWEGSDAIQTAVPPISIGSMNGIACLKGHFEWLGTIIVTAGGYNTLLFGGEVEAGKPVTISEASIEIWQ